MQARHHDRGGARIERDAPLPPKLIGDEERVDGDHHRPKRDAGIAALGQAGNLAEDQPRDGAGEGGDRPQPPAMKQPHAIPNHAAGHEDQRFGIHRRHFEQRRRRAP